ncbi:hypothetical protein G7Z17_g6320 [Cylindrodendrum hubeiense]|uniref:Amidohydrolase-related domain-containing protein n=1 Tax=Cylindrodendrum hubeiense TaxID=595255 RepID=A0A9P5LAY3_9HYPO|nr:hypothetical protein G7Z17_g6320 [Cylindrodendrum hubeiense]
MDSKQEMTWHHMPASRRAERSQTWLHGLKTASLYGFALIGIAHMVSYLQPFDGSLIPSGNHRIVDRSKDIYPDTDYPLRPAEEPWDISASYPYPKRLKKTVSEGTWLRIATHPLNNEIVFDMLGDLYCMSTNSSEDVSEASLAHPILAGIPYDKEAEFSSDGSRIVFISDAGFGVDNIWTMPYTTCGDMAKQTQKYSRQSTIQQTNSTFRFFSSPAFHPTEPKIIATKWFLSGRPNGAGEIWEFPVRADNFGPLPERSGRRVVARKLPASWSKEQYFESQLGSEQARYTPSGDAIVFSRNVRDDASGKFSYNKDVHAGINAVFLVNTNTNETTELVAAAASEPNKPASPGGANMPRLSRDGKTLAFVRRSNDKEVLVLKDMGSGTVHYIWDGLSYDLSTIPAFMGAYPNYGWAANDSMIIMWSQGQIWKVPLHLNHIGERVVHGSPKKIPFKATIDIALGETRYSETNIKTNQLASHGQEKALRKLRSDFEGNYVVFEGAGDGYVFDVTSGDLQAIRKPDDFTSCYGPSFIGGSRYIVQACWDDEDFTTFHLFDRDDKSSVKIEGLPRGRYISPISDGTHIAYIRTGKDYMFGDVEETFGEGIWIADIQLPTTSSGTASLQAPRRLPIQGYNTDSTLDFSIDTGRLILLVHCSNTIVQYDVESGISQKIAASKTSVEMKASTLKQRTVAFRDFQHIWLSAEQASRHGFIWSKPGHSQTPTDLVRLSEVGGHDVTFSADGQKAFWLFGPSLYVADVRNVVRGCKGASLKSRDSGNCARPFISSQDLNVTFETTLYHQIRDSGGKPFTIINASLISMDPTAPESVQGSTVVIKNGQIIAVGAGSEVDIPTDSKILDAQGGAVLPGFVDVHGHWGGFISPYPLQSWEMETFLGYGVTTIHNPASKNVAGNIERTLIEKGRMYGPQVFHTGDVLYGSTQPSVYTEINSRADARDALLRIKAEGGDSSFSAKNYQLVARSARQRLLLEAAELGMLVVPEGGWSFDWGLTYFIDGYTSQEHPLPVPELYDDVLSLVAASGSSYTPIAVMNYGGIFGQHWIHQSENIPGNEKLRKYVKHDILESLTEVKQAPNSSYLLFNTTRSTAKLAKRGVRTNVGAHGEQPIGHLYHAEMRMMALGGQTPYDVLRHATIGGATSLGLNSSIGSIEVGKLADLVIYPPGVDSVQKVWEESGNMKYVMRGGTAFDVEDGLVEIWPREGRKQLRASINPDEMT